MSFNEEIDEPLNSSLCLRFSRGNKKRNDDEIVSRSSSSRATTDEVGERNRSLTYNRLCPKQYNKSRSIKRKLDKEEHHGPLVLVLKRNRANDEENEITSFGCSNLDRSETNIETTAASSSPLKLSFKRNSSNGIIEFVPDVNLVESSSSDSDDESQPDYHYNGWAAAINEEEIDECDNIVERNVMNVTICDN